MESSVLSQDNFRRHHYLREMTRCLIRRINSTSSTRSSTGDQADSEEQAWDVVVTLNEINDRHGTGPLIKRLYQGDSNVLSIRSRNHYGEQDFGVWDAMLPQRDKPRHEAFRDVIRLLLGKRIRNVLCVPYHVDEILTALAIKEVFGAKLLAYIMDDQNVAVDVVPDHLMREFLEKCSLRFATHPELAGVYEQKYGLRFHILPAIVPAHLIRAAAELPETPQTGCRAALLGSFWDQTWFDRLCDILSTCRYQIDWYGNNRSPWLRFPPEALERAGITPLGVVSEDRLAKELRGYPFTIIPTGLLGAGERNKGVASLSLPGRILFALAASHTPLLLVGSDKTCGARFVKHFGLGEVVPYDAGSLRAAMVRLQDPDRQTRIRTNAAKLAPHFSDAGVAEWMQRSIELGEPADQRFEAVFAGYDRNLAL